ncbi:MAG: hypothetical protein ACKORL_02190, partial [Phycisphaerales bacterium]
MADVFDTPGAREGMDAIERADLLVALTAPGLGWAAPAAPRTADATVLRVLNQCDRADAAACAEATGADLA